MNRERPYASYRCNLCRRVFSSRKLLQRHCQENETHLQLKWEKEQKLSSSISPDHAVSCGLCKKPFETDKPITLSRHLQNHYLEFNGRHYCWECEVYFVHEADLEAHHRWAAQGSCGMKFEHNRHCTGHHPPRRSQAREQDRVNFCLRLRQWEKTQLEAFKTSVEALTKARKDAEAKAKAPESKFDIDKLLDALGKGAPEKKPTSPAPDNKSKAVDTARKAAIQRVWTLANIIAVYQQKGWTRDEIGAAIQARLTSA